MYNVLISLDEGVEENTIIIWGTKGNLVGRVFTCALPPLQDTIRG